MLTSERLDAIRERANYYKGTFGYDNGASPDDACVRFGRRIRLAARIAELEQDRVILIDDAQKGNINAIL